jgi:hypothetical protein
MLLVACFHTWRLVELRRVTPLAANAVPKGTMMTPSLNGRGPEFLQVSMGQRADPKAMHDYQVGVEASGKVMREIGPGTYLIESPEELNALLPKTAKEDGHESK